MFYFCPRPCRQWRGLALILPLVSLKRINLEVGKEQRHICWARGRATSPRSQSPHPHLVWFTLISSVWALFSACSQPFPDAALSGWPRASGRMGESKGFPWENMLWDAIRAKNMWPLSSTLISQSKTQGFLPSGVSDQQKRRESKSPWLGLKHVLAKSPTLCWRNFTGLIGGCNGYGANSAGRPEVTPSTATDILI